MARSVRVPAPKVVMSKSTVAKKASRGVDMGKKNVPGKTGFDTVANKAAKAYGSAEAGKRVAAAAMNKMRSKGML